ncbi:trans-aconitate 2-methyltransferase [Mesorhizobium sp. ASY16-5R]|jgi:trans-aconitate 2-methyltransferase|uniref:trans-aconitate 2-methyltransferase n=1 Tax=Mesorhizobium sp. ASY16-5R TaxID=3445772 RepID=UPI003F9EDC3F
MRKTTKDWSAQKYLQFENERTRPARDLLAHVPLEAPRRVVDIGCGPGNSTELLIRRWPEAKVSGIDSSPAMIAEARKRLPQVDFALADIATWTPGEPVDVLFANAVLQWLPDHAALLPKLFGLLAPGGVMAIQMPDNIGEPSHRLMRETAAAVPFAAKLADAARPQLPPVGLYYDLLAPHAARVDVWHVAYNHPLADAGAIVDWVSSTGLRPFLDPLDAGEQAQFLAAYTAGIAAAYPPRVDGRVLLRFPRMFIVAQRA